MRHAVGPRRGTGDRPRGARRPGAAQAAAARPARRRGAGRPDGQVRRADSRHRAPRPRRAGLPPAPGAAPGPGPAAPPALAAPAPPVDALPAVARFRALLGAGTGLSYRAAEPIDPATGSVRLLGATLAREGGKAEIETLTLDGLAEARIGAASAREVTLTLGDTTARIARLELRGLAAPGGTPEALALDQLRLEILTVEGDASFAIAEAVLEDYAAGRPGRLTLAGIDALLPQAGLVDRVRVGRVALRGLDLPGSLSAMGSQTTPPRASAGYAMEIESLLGSLAGQPVGGFGSLRLQGDPPAGEIETGRLALRDLRVEPSPPLEDWLRRLGYPALLADLTAESRYDRARGRLELGSLSLAGREMGVLGLSLALEGVTPEAAEAQDWEQLRLAGLALRLLDQSLLGRVARDAARQGRTTEAQVREGWARQAAAMLGAGPRGPAPGGIGPILVALQRFLRGEAKEVEVTARPPQPVALGELPAALMGGAAAVQRVLGLGAVAR
ncbi:hypothetical protein [Dankookia sp. P2]|uniref:hypothetical protein n=1 Tax=Dankookia sp. P2 TaxID=3423955 RepID=UPI003D66B5BD